MQLSVLMPVAEFRAWMEFTIDTAFDRKAGIVFIDEKSFLDRSVRIVRFDFFKRPGELLEENQKKE